MTAFQWLVVRLVYSRVESKSFVTVVNCPYVARFCDRGKLPGSKIPVCSHMARFCNHGKLPGSKTDGGDADNHPEFCNHGKSSGSKTSEQMSLLRAQFCNRGKPLGSKTVAARVVHELAFCNRGKLPGSKTDGLVFHVLPAVLWTPSDVKPRLFRSFATRSRPFSNGFSETFFTVANDNGASLWSYDRADTAGQTPGTALVVSLVLVKHERQDGLRLDLRANQLPSLRV